MLRFEITGTQGIKYSINERVGAGSEGESDCEEARRRSTRGHEVKAAQSLRLPKWA